MLETYKVGVTLELTGNVSSALDKMMRDLEGFNKLVKETSSSLSGLRKDFRALGDAAGSIGKLSAAMDKLSSAKGIGSMVGDIDKMAGATRDATAAAEQLGRVIRENARIAAEAARLGAGGGGGGGGGRPRSSGGTGGHGSGHDLMLTGLGASMVGAPVVSGVQGALERAFAVEHLRVQMMADGRVSAAQANAAVNAATSSAPGTRVTENLGALIDLKNVTGSLDEAETALPKFAQLSALLQVMDRRSGGGGDPAYAAAKAMEIMGQIIEETTDPKTGRVSREINPAMLNQHLEAMARVAVATNMRVSPSDYLGFAKQARVAGMMLSDEFIYEKLPAWMQTTGGPRVGTALMSMAQVFSGGKLTPKSLAAMTKIGLAKDGKVLDLDLMRTDPLKYMQAAQARMDAAGIHGTEAQLTALMTASQRSTIAGALAELLKDMPAILKEQANIRATNPDAFTHFAGQDPEAKLQQFQAAFDKLMTTMGSSGMGDAVALMDKVTAGLNKLADWAKANPDEARIAFDVAGGLGAIAVALGTLSTAIFLFGPALKLLGVTGGGAAAAAGGAGGGALAAVLGGTILPPGAFLAGTMYPSDTQGGAADRAPYGGKSLAQRFPGLVVSSDTPLGPTGNPVPSGAPQMSLGTAGNPVHTVVQNGRDIANGVTGFITRGLTAPGGTTGFDIRATPLNNPGALP
jgi:hypothetical protein